MLPNSRQVPSGRLYRVNLMLGDDDSAWLDQLASEIEAATGAQVSRSEIVRAAIAGLRELHHLTAAGDVPGFPSLTTCQSGRDLAMLGVLAARCATQERS
jgi:hypothetical protein